VTIALVTTVRDEEALLRHNLAYHHYMGVDLCLVYSDRSTDGTVASVDALPYVRVSPSLGAAALADRPEAARAVAHHGTHATARQVVNMFDAIERARAAGCAWLLATDADELVCPDLDRAEPGGLRALLDRTPSEIECVRFPALEVVQRGLRYENVFAEETLFKRPGAPIVRRVRDPLRGGTVRTRGFYGHTEGKSAVRLAADAVPRTPHRFTRPDGGALATVAAGWLLHYYCHDVASFVAKFRRFGDHPDRYLWDHAVEPVKRLWRDVVNRPGITAEEVERYYRRWVMFDDAEVRRLRRSAWLGLFPRRPAVVEVTAPQQVFQALARLDVGAQARA
jgi:hypothetical protein